MSTLIRKYQPSRFDHIENVEDYTPGGFHPIQLGDILNNRYKIVHKLGYGGFSTVWLTKDFTFQRFVALKIIRADASKECTDLRILQGLRQGIVEHPGKRYVASLLDHFLINGPNGSHICLVYQAAGPSIAKLDDCPGKVMGSRRLRSDLARKFARQASQAIDFIHSKGVCHGDFTTSNILVKLASIETWSEDDVYQHFGKPMRDTVLGITGSAPGASAPEYLVETISFNESQYLSDEILIVDFGQAFRFCHPPAFEHIGIPYSYCAPEVLFGSTLSPQSDIWALGCVLFEIRAGQALFTSWDHSRDEILRQMIQTYGKLPEQWWALWENRKLFFNDDGKPKRLWDGGIVRAIEYPIESMIADIGSEDEEDGHERKLEKMLEPRDKRVSTEEAAQLKDLLNNILKWMPEDRPSSREVLCQSWLQLDTESHTTKSIVS